MIVELVWETLFALGVGGGLAATIWYFHRKKRRALRSIDLISYAITIVALGSALFSVGRYQERLQASFERLRIHSAVADTGWDTMMGYLNACPDVRHSPFQLVGKKKSECHQFGEMLRSSQPFDFLHPNTMVVPDISIFTVPELRTLASQLASQIQAINNNVLAYKVKSEGAGIGFWEPIFFQIAIPLLGFAFGLGAARRTLDLYTDWSS